MNNLLKNILMGIFAVMLLTSTLTLGVQNGINIPKIEDRVEEQVSNLHTMKTENDAVKLGSVHPIIQIAEATKEIDNEIESEEYSKKIDYNKSITTRVYELSYNKIKMKKYPYTLSEYLENNKLTQEIIERSSFYRNFT